MTGFGGADRRTYPRVNVAFALRLGIELDTAGSTPASGTTVNISRGGMLAAIDQRLSLQSRCSIRFTDAGARLAPHETSGRVLRIKPRRTDFLIAVEFDSPLDHLEVEPTLWAKQKLPFQPSGG